MNILLDVFLVKTCKLIGITNGHHMLYFCGIHRLRMTN